MEILLAAYTLIFTFMFGMWFGRLITLKQVKEVLEEKVNKWPI